MRNTFSFLVGLGLLLSLRAAVAAPVADNDGFQRRNGQMYILRNGQLRAMTRDSRLPTGVMVTKDGFVVDARGRRTELREGQGCDLKGNVVAVAPTAAGGLVLATPARAPRSTSAQPRPAAVRVVVGGPELYGRGPAERYEADEDDKHSEKAWEHRKKEEEKRWERDKKYAEKAHEKNKKWKEKRHKGKKWDD